MTEKIGTLKELAVKPGDVVEWHEPWNESCGRYNKLFSGIPMTVRDDLWVKCRRTDGINDGFPYTCNHKFRLISRATPTPSIDLTAITTPFGLLDKATQDALIAHGGPYEYYDGGDGWLPTRHCNDVPRYAHRVKPGPKRETVTKGAWLDRVTGEVTVCDECNCTITYDTIDGEIDMATYKVTKK